VVTIFLNRPKVNALNLELIAAMKTAFRQAERDPQVHCVLLTGSGSVFSAGQDVSEFAKGPVSIRYHLLRTYNPLVVQIRKLEKPVLAAINGVVSGAALGLALACDLRIASDQARFVVGFSGIGLAPDSAVSLLLPVLIGLGRASEYTFTNAPITAEQALAWGLVNRLAPADRLNQEAEAWAQQLARSPMGAMALAKRDLIKQYWGISKRRSTMKRTSRTSPEKAASTRRGWPPIWKSGRRNSSDECFHSIHRVEKNDEGVSHAI
jgi:2-(1,2-epoxy-1,2-dihydrophenyl)acetyl-CoA isomerase